MKRYDDSSIKVLSDAEHIRLRPFMYISANSPALQMFEEIFSNSLDEAINGYADHVKVSIDYEDSKIRIEDNGRGLPQGMNETLGKPTIEIIYTKLNSGGKYTQDAYTVSGGLHGVGSCVVCALSESLSVATYREDKGIFAKFSRGDMLSINKIKNPKKGSGTIVEYSIDTTHDLFKEDQLSKYQRDIEFRMSLVSTLHPEVQFYYQGEKVSPKHISEFLPQVDYVLPEPLEYTSGYFSLAINWTQSLRSGTYDSYCNLIHTVSGGDHIYAIEEALLKVFPQERDILLGMNLVVSVTFPNVSYTSQSKDRAKSADMRSKLYEDVRYLIAKSMRDNPELKKIIDTMLSYKRSELDKKSSRKTVRKSDRKTAFLQNLNSGGFADCTTRNRGEAELAICEGLSAAGSLKQARNVETQAVLPLRGKFINAYTSPIPTVLKNAEANTLVNCIGTGLFDDFDISKSRYDKIIIFTDADPDGGNIACQLIAFFAKIMPELLLRGMIYLALPPLYGTSENGTFIPIYEESVKDKYIKRGYYVQRYKGLGEMMPEQLRVSSFDKDTRRLTQLIVDETSLSTVERILGGESKHRKDLLIEMGVFKEWRD